MISYTNAYPYVGEDVMLSQGGKGFKWWAQPDEICLRIYENDM
jgi:hypothetical protein